jgi:hypothetical protein
MVVSLLWRSSRNITVCIGRKGKLDIRLHSLDRARLRRGSERLRWKSWSWFPVPAISGATGGISGFMFPKAKTTQGSCGRDVLPLLCGVPAI